MNKRKLLYCLLVTVSLSFAISIPSSAAVRTAATASEDNADLNARKTAMYNRFANLDMKLHALQAQASAFEYQLASMQQKQETVQKLLSTVEEQLTESELNKVEKNLISDSLDYIKSSFSEWDDIYRNLISSNQVLFAEISNLYVNSYTVQSAIESATTVEEMDAVEARIAECEIVMSALVAQAADLSYSLDEWENEVLSIQQELEDMSERLKTPTVMHYSSCDTETQAPIYSVSGTRLPANSVKRHGIYIQNGKKFIKK